MLLGERKRMNKKKKRTMMMIIEPLTSFSSRRKERQNRKFSLPHVLYFSPHIHRTHRIGSSSISALFHAGRSTKVCVRERGRERGHHVLFDTLPSLSS